MCNPLIVDEVVRCHAAPIGHARAHQTNVGRLTIAADYASYLFTLVPIDCVRKNT